MLISLKSTSSFLGCKESADEPIKTILQSCYLSPITLCEFFFLTFPFDCLLQFFFSAKNFPSVSYMQSTISNQELEILIVVIFNFLSDGSTV